MKRIGINRVGTRTRTVAPSAKPVGVSDAKEQTRVDTTAEDALIDRLISAATGHVERQTNRALITQTWQLQLDGFPSSGVIRLLPAPVQSVTSVTYTDEDGTTQTLAASTYVVDTTSEPGRVVLKRDEQWPTDVLQRGGSVVVEFVAGYGSNPSDVPESLRHAVLMLVAHWYENRESVAVGTVPRAMEQAVGALMESHRIRVVA